MNGQSPVEERLRTIRALVERAPIYRAIGARCALVAGSLSILSAAIVYLNDEGRINLGRTIRSRDFATIWIDVILVSIVTTILFLWSEARRSGRPFFSAELHLALNQIGPCLLFPAAFTAWFLGTGYLGAQELNLVVVWIAFYGLTLLSVSIFAPRSLVLLGWAFLLTSLAVPVALNAVETYFSFNVPNVLMGMTFGIYHLIYAALNWSRKPATAHLP
jgi:hypothetical protein